MIENPLATTVKVPCAGKYALKVACHLGRRSDNPQVGVYVNGKHHRSFEHLPIGQGGLELDAGEVDLIEGENTVGFDSGVTRASWSDGTVAEWKTPLLRKGLRIWKGDTVYAEDFDRMWPDTWSGQKKDILLHLGRFPTIMETAARVAKREFSNPVSVHPRRPRQTGRPADHEWRGGARAFAAGSGHPHSIQPMKGDLGKPCAITR